jgi:predicted secreted protein
MGWITLLAVYFVIWWLTLFCVLPFGVNREDTVTLGNDPGAPKQSRIVLKLVINTFVALAAWFVVFLIDRYDLIRLQ